MTPAMWYRLQGHTPAPVLTRDEQIAEWEHRRAGCEAGADPYCVARTYITDEHYVSTVFLGLDHNLGGDGPPILFESMVFPETDVCERYATWDEAVAGHERIVAAEIERRAR